MDQIIANEIEKTVAYLKKGKVVLYPTETVWGIGCDAANGKAINKVYRIKQRSESKSMIVLLHDRKELGKYVKEVPSVAFDIMDKATSPVTIIYAGGKDILKHVRADDGTVAIRIIEDDFCSQVIEKLGHPLVSTSANFSGEPTPATFRQIDDGIKENVDYVVGIYHARLNSVKPSTLIKLNKNGTFKIMRP